MSQWRGRLEDTPELESASDWISDNYHIPVVALLLAFMLWSRLRNWRNFVVDGRVLFNGQDAWYHYRTVRYTVQNWPSTMPFDPWTYFPYGTSSGQFGTLFDQIIATAALVVGLGSPDQQTVGLTLLVAPAFFGAAAAIPAYFIGRRIGGKMGGVVTVTVLALSVGSFFARSRVGFSDHHVAEALFQTIGILGVMVAVTVAHRDKPIYEQLVERDYASLRPTLVWSGLAGLAMTLYLWVWPFGVVLLGIVGAFLLLQMNLEVLRGESPEHTAFAGAVMMGVTGVAILSSFRTTSMTASDYSILHPLVAFGIAAGCVFVAWLAREWEARDVDRKLYPVAILGVILGLALFASVALPTVFDYILSQLLRIFGLGFTTSQQGATVGEVQPLVNWDQQGLGDGVRQLYNAYGFAVFLGLVGAVAVLAREFWDEYVPAEQLLVVVWGAFLLAMTFTQGRFQYYLVFPLAALTGYAVSIVVGWIDLDGDIREIETYQVLAVVAVVLVILVPVAPDAVAAGQGNGPSGDVQAWNDGLGWMEENTPEEGTFNGSGEPLDYGGTYPRVDDHDYDEGEYGVMSWWDYGHHITSLGERIPNANPFQQGADTAAEFLLAQNESSANDVLADVDEDDAKTRYVVVDWKMTQTYTSDIQGSPLGGKFFAPSQFSDKYTRSDFYETNYFSPQGQAIALYNYQKQPYYDSTAVRLYEFHGSAVEPEPIVLDWELREHDAAQTSLPQPPQGNATSIKEFDSMEEAREYVQNDGTSQIGGIGPHPEERVPAMEHYRLVDTSDMSAMQSNQYTAGWARTIQGTGLQAFLQENRDGNLQSLLYEFTHQTRPAWTKTFERVPGATVQGSGPADATVSASVEMEMPGTSETFVYTQQAQTDADGEFEMTVPYSTTGYDEWGPDEGHTNVSVRANSSYQFRTIEQAENGTVYGWTGTTDVSEGQVIGEDSSSATVDLERSVLADPNDQNESSDEAENATSGNETSDAGNETSGNVSSDSGSNESGSDGNASGLLAPAAHD